MTLVSGIDPSVDAASGTRSYVLALAEKLGKRNISVTLVARNGSASMPGVSYLRIRSRPTSVWFLLGLAASAGSLPIPDGSIIHAQRPDDLVPFVLAKRRNPKVCTLHGIPALSVRRRRGAGYGIAYRMLERIGLKRTERVIAVDSGTAKWYVERYPWLADRTEVVPVAVDLEHFRPMNREASRQRFSVIQQYAVAYAGRLTVEKRVDAVAKAMRNLPRAELLVAGGGPEETRIRELASGANVRFLGPIAHGEMPMFLNAADLLVLPSEYEGMPTIAIEALACGVPVVSTPVGALPEIIVPGKTGWVVSNLQNLRSTLERALPEAWAMRDACVAAAKQFSWDTVIDRILSVYRQAEVAA